MITEATANNSHFAAELLAGNDNPQRRRVDLSFFVWNINDIDVINQRFSVRLNIYASWEEDVENITVSDDDTNFGKSNFKWDPQLRYTNCYEQNADEYENWWRVLALNDLSTISPSTLSEHKRVRVMYCQLIQGWFHEGFEMQNFPFDLQHLHIGITSLWDHNNVALSFDKRKPTRVSGVALTSQTWDMYKPRLFAYDTDWDNESMPLLSQSTDSVTGARYCRAYLALTLCRRPNFIMFNVMTIMTLVGTFSFATFALDPSELGDRQACVLTLVLTTVAFKFVTTQMMPEISYVTMMDVVIYACMFLQGFMLLSICISANVQDPVMFDYGSAIVLGTGWLGILMWFCVRSLLLTKGRNKYIYECNQKFQSTQYDSALKEVFYSEAATPPHGRLVL